VGGGSVNDEFLKQFRENPDPVFANVLFRRINEQKNSSRSLIRVAFAFASLVILFSVVLSVSPSVRASTLAIIREIGGLVFIETSDYPGKSISREADVTFHGEAISLEKARVLFGSPISLPTYVPEGFQMENKVTWFAPEPEGTHSMVIINWNKQTKQGGNNIVLQIVHIPIGSPDQKAIVGEGAVEEIEINGKKAALVRGAWNPQTRQYQITNLVEISWNHTIETLYKLITVDDHEKAVEELVLMAESIP
jgi:hypothetical protein